MISIVLLGTGGAIPTPTRAPSASWITLDDRSFLLDPGPGALSRLVKPPHGPNSLDAVTAVLLTHLHPDHCADLVPLLFALRLRISTSEAPLQIIGPRGLAGYLAKLHELYGEWTEPRLRPVIVIELEPGDRLSPSSDTGGIWAVTSIDTDPSVICFSSAHFEDRFSAWNLGFRFTDLQGHTLVCSGDSGPCRAAEPASVVLTHLDPLIDRLDAAALVREQWQGEVVAARDDDRFTVPPSAVKDPSCDR